MRITDLSIKFKTSTVVLTIVLTVGGLLSYLTIPKEASPSIEIPIIVVTTVYPGVSPDDIESLITQHIEQEVQSVNGIKEIRSTSTEGVSTVVIEFDPEVSISWTLGSSTSVGRSGFAMSTLSRTFWYASSIDTSGSNSITTVLTPSVEVDRISLIPLTD